MTSSSNQQRLDDLSLLMEEEDNLLDEDGYETTIYKASKTMTKFHRSTAFVRLLIGCIGSGKSVACCVEVFRKGCQQDAYPETSNKSIRLVRRSRWVIIRNTYRELVDTTIQTFRDWFPLELGFWEAGNMKFTFKQLLDDGTYLHLEVLFRALDRPQDIKKLLSLELTGGFINEAREIPKQVLDMLIGRLGRYPKIDRKKKQFGASWHGCILDTNPPDSDHWIYSLFEEKLPDDYAIFHQPSGVSEEAENIENLPNLYYERMQGGKTKEWVNVYVHGLYGFISDGKPVWPEYKDDIHSTDKELPLSGSGTIFVGIDFGLTPAAAIGQLTTSGQFQVIDEFVTEDMGAMNFGKLLHEKLSREYCGCKLEIYADPAGIQRAQTDEQTPFMILSNQGIDAYPTYTNDFTIRREAVADYMQRLDFNGKSAFIVGPKAIMCRKALGGGYKYKRMQVSGEERFTDMPDKSKYSHIGDAIQYLMLGAVGGERVIGGFDHKLIDYSETNRMIR